MAELKKRYCSAVNECSKVLCIEWQNSLQQSQRYNKLAKLAIWSHQEIRMLMQCFTESWPSGRWRWSWKPLYGNVPGVRIPYSPRNTPIFTSESLVPSVMITVFMRQKSRKLGSVWFCNVAVSAQFAARTCIASVVQCRRLELLLAVSSIG